MAAGDKLWLELGVRDEISNVLDTLMRNAQKVGDMLTDDAKELKNYYRNINDIAGVYDKIYVAQKRISELDGSSLSAGEKKGLKDMSKSLEDVRKEFESMLKDPDRILGKGESSFEKLRTSIELMVKDTLRYVDGIEAKEKAEAINAANEERRIDSLKAKYYDLQRQRKDLSDAIANAAPGSNTSNAISLLNSITGKMGAVSNAQRRGTGMPASLVGADADEFDRKVRAEIAGLTSATNDYNRSLESNYRLQKQLERAYLDAQSQQKIADIRNQRAEYTALGQKMNDIGILMGELSRDRANVLGGGQAVLTQEKVMERLDAINRSYNETLAQGREQEKQSSQSKKQLADASEKVAKSTHNMVNANRGLMNTFKELENAGKNTNRMIDQMTSSFNTMFSFYGMKRLMEQVITIGGQFEFQHVALQNILGDIQEANTLFTQLQELAIESPKTFMELTSYAKQLSAYQIPANELYDTTKRLADMSTGLGVDMGRLILAYGQVRSAAVLRGQELRQFTEAGIPLVQKLADKFTEMNGKLTTTADVFKLISARKVPFEMVRDVLWDMTNQGGQFYNMQSELADTLYGKWQKLQDTWQIMLGHIADGNSAMGSFLRTSLDAIVAITRGLDVLLPLFAGFGLSKLYRGTSSIISSNYQKLQSRTDEGAISMMRLAKEKEANRLMRERYQMGRMLTAQEWELIRTKNQVTLSDKLQLAYEGKISNLKLGRAMAEAREAYLQERINLLQKGYTQEEARQLLMDKERNILLTYRYMLMQGYTKEQLRGNAPVLNDSKTMLGNIKSGLWGLIGGWPGLILTAFGGIMSAFSYINEKTKELSDKGDAMMNHAQQNANSLEKTLNSIDKEESVEKKVEALEEALINIGSTGESVVARSREHMDDINKRWKVLKEGAEEYQKVLVTMGNTQGKALFEKALDDSDIESRLKKYDSAVSDVFKYYSTLNKFSEVFKGLISKYQGGPFNALKGKNLYEQIDMLGADNLMRDIDEKLKGLRKNTAERAYLLQAQAALRQHLENIDKVKEKWDDITNKSIPEMADELKSAARLNGIENFDSLTAEQKSSLETLTREYVNSIAEGSVEAKNKLAQELASQVFHIKIIGDLTIDKTKLGSFASYIWSRFGGDSDLNRKLGDKGNIRIGNSVYSKAQVANIFTDIDEYDKNTTKQINSLRNTLKLQRNLKDGAGLVKDTEKKINDILSERRAIGLDDPKEKGSGGSKKDAQLEAVKNRVDLYKKFYSELESYTDLYGKAGALSKLRKDGEFGTVFGWDNVSDLTNYKKTIGELTSELNNNTEARDKFLNTTKADIQARKRKEETEAIKNYISELQRMFSVMSENYQTYKKWVELTGDSELAARVAGVTQNTSMSDWLTDQMNNALKKTNFALSAEDVFGLSETDVKKLGKDSAIFDIWKDWQENQKKIRNEQRDLYEEAYKGAKNYDDKIADINRDLQKHIDAVNTLAVSEEVRQKLINNLQKNAENQIGSVQWDKFKEENNWGQVFGSLEKMPLDTIRKMITAMKEYGKTTKMSVEDTKAFYEALEKLMNREAVLDPIKSLTKALEDYQTAHSKRLIIDQQIQRTKNDPELSEEKKNKIINALEKERINLLNQEADALARVSAAIKSFSSHIKRLGSSLSQLGGKIGGKFGDIMNGVSGMFDDLSSGLDSIGDLSAASSMTGIVGAISKVSSVLGIASATISFVQRLDSWLPSSESIYQKYADRQRELNEARERLEDYQVAFLKSEQKRQNWLYNTELAEIRQRGYLQENLLENYAKTVMAPQEIYQEARSGLSKWGAAIVGAIVGAVITAVTWGSGGPLGVAAGTAIASALGGTAATAIGAAVAIGAGAAIGTAMRSVADSIFYKEGQTSARANMRVQTQHASFWRGEKTQNLEEWVQENYGKKLFDRDFHGYDLIDVDLAKSILDSDVTLVGETRKTLERIVELTEQIEEIEDQAHEYVSQRFSPLVDNMTDSLWDWLSDGENMLDSFHNYASSTFADIAKDAVKSFLKINLMDQFTKPLNDMYEAFSFGLIDEAALTFGVADIAGQISEKFESLIPVLEELGTAFVEAFNLRDIDILGSDKSSSMSREIKSVTENTAGLIASYLNSVRADTSVNRMTLTQILIAVQTQVEMPVIARAQLQQLQVIAGNTGRNVEIVDSIYSLLHSIAPDGTAWKIK